MTNAYAVDLSAGAGGKVTVGSVITARFGIQNTGSSVYAIDVLAAGQLSNIFLQNGVAAITNAGLDHSRPYDLGKRRPFDHQLQSSRTDQDRNQQYELHGRYHDQQQSGRRDRGLPISTSPSTRVGSGNVTLNNHGTIKATGSTVIALGGNGTRTITNDGTIAAISPFNVAIFAGGSSVNFDNRHGTIIGLVNLSDGNDTFLGGAGDERITDGRGDDSIDGAGGNDTLVCALVGSSTPLTIDLSITTAQATGAGNDILIGIENVVSSFGNDTLKGSDADNSLNGNAGQDSLTGAVGNDTLDGGSGNDTLDGGDGFDTAVFDSQFRLLRGSRT